jgi:hypothetical protein
MICGKMVPSVYDVATLAATPSLWLDNDDVITTLFDAVLGDIDGNNIGDATCRALCRANICPALVNVDGKLEYNLLEMRSPRRRTTASERIILDLRHDQSVDLLILVAFGRESERLQASAPLVEHMLGILPCNLYRLYHPESRIQQLRHSRLWREFIYSRLTCRQHMHHLSLDNQLRHFDVCDACTLECARECFVANWFRPLPLKRMLAAADGDNREQLDGNKKISRASPLN